MAVVPNRSDILKQNCLQSFKTRRFHFATGVKIRTATDGGGSKQKRHFKAELFIKL
ncbi:hypothetical protein HMPREF9554_01650 [Treponema phagedenis F0421]|nr:hypothetical protein HMPREF9554_01650 [Treponema phagedenis F0421]